MDSSQNEITDSSQNEVMDTNNLKSKLNSDIISKFTKNDKILINNNNTYLEFNIINDDNNYILNTEQH